MLTPFRADPSQVLFLSAALRALSPRRSGDSSKFKTATRVTYKTPLVLVALSVALEGDSGSWAPIQPSRGGFVT